MRPPVDARYPTIRQFAVQLGRSPSEFVQKFRGRLPCYATGRIVVPAAVKALRLWGYPVRHWRAEKRARRRKSR